MNILEKIQSRIKYSRLYHNGKSERLYISYGQQGNGIKTSAWLEVVNDAIQVFVRVENIRHQNYYDDELAARYRIEIERQFHEIIHRCEMERKKVPLHERLRDDVVPVYDDRSLQHQVDALRFCCSMKVSALYADTGTGKSKIAIDLAVSRYEAGQIKKVLVFLPVSTKKNFQNQIAQWCTCKELVWKLVGHESMGSSDRTVLEVLGFVDSETQIIIDESHAIKTPTAKRSKRIKQVCEHTSYKLVMTGTPVTDNVHDLYMQYSVLSHEIIGVRDWKKFEERYLIMGGRLGDEIIGYKNIDHLIGLLEPYTYQIAKEECLILPAKTFHTHTCALNSKQETLYFAEKERLLEVILSDNFRATDIFHSFTRMQQICSGYHAGEVIGTEKIGLLQSIPLQEKTVFFCKYLFEIDLLVEYLGRRNCALFTGCNPAERDSELAAFVKGNRQYFVATMQSGGTGLNGLQEVCNEVVFFSNSFSYFHRKQSIGRIDRQGQQRAMIIRDMRTEANIDDKIMRNLARKGNLANEIKQMMLDKTLLKKYVEEL
jgi:SNF2 family DNA or RNA helicase